MPTTRNIVLLLIATLLTSFPSSSIADPELGLTEEHSGNNTSDESDHNHSSFVNAIAHAGRKHALLTGNKTDTAVVSQWQDLESISAKLAVRLVYENLLPIIDELFDQNNVSTNCQATVYKVLRDAATLKKYAVQSKSNRYRLEYLEMNDLSLVWNESNIMSRCMPVLSGSTAVLLMYRCSWTTWV